MRISGICGLCLALLVLVGCEEPVGNPALSASARDAAMVLCAPPEQECSGTCVNTEVSPANCGGCGIACAAGQLCSAGACVDGCTVPSIACGGGCVNPSSDNQHCGGCGQACSAEQRCSGGACVCLAGRSACGASCVDLQNDGNNCGACGQRCGAGQTCASGVCQAPAVDPCGGVPATGRCASATRVEFCSVSTGSGTPALRSVDCAGGEQCQLVSGRATCVLTAPCRTGDRQCGDANTLRICESGSWRNVACSRGCVSNAIDEGCAPDIALRSTPLTGRITYETKPPNAGFTDWGTPFYASAQGFLVLVTRPDGMGGAQFIDAQVTTLGNDTTGGRFSVRVPAVTTADDRLIVLATGVDSTRQLVYAVADPGHAASTAEHELNDITANSRLWSWNAALNTLADGDTIPISIANGSGAARVFDYARYVYSVAADFYRPTTPQSLIVWVGLGTSWSCGACYAPERTTRWSIPFMHQSWIAGGSDERYWSDAVTAHELGHYVMSAFGRSPGEGGPHTIGVATNPGQAWSEGWATFFSSGVRSSSRYYDKQGGGFFSVDIERRLYSPSTVWRRPQSSGGLFQLMDENEVSAMLWALRRDAAGGTLDPFLSALSSGRMTLTPFARGYTRRQWTRDPRMYAVTSESAPMVADMFDALVCGRAVSAAALDRVTEPELRYPFPSDRPLCREGQSPIRAELHERQTEGALPIIELSVDVSRDALYEVPVQVTIELPDGVELLGGTRQQALPPEYAPTTSRVSWRLVAAGMPNEDIVVRVRAETDGFTFHAPLRYRFGRTSGDPSALQFDSQRLRLRGADVGPSIRVAPARLEQ